jgi:hypothetical protein
MPCYALLCYTVCTCYGTVDTHSLYILDMPIIYITVYIYIHDMHDAHTVRERQRQRQKQTETLLLCTGTYIMHGQVKTWGGPGAELGEFNTPHCIIIHPDLQVRTLSLCLSFCLSVSLSVSLTLCLCLSLSLFLSLSVPVSVSASL